MNAQAPCLGASLALQHPRLLPQAASPGYCHRGNSTRGNALWVLQGKKVQRREGEVVGGEKEGTHSSAGNLRRPAPPWAPSVGQLSADGAPPSAGTPFSSLFTMA